VIKRLSMLGPGEWNQSRRLATQGVSFATLLFASSLIAKPSPSANPNEQILRAQLFLDGSNFKPGDSWQTTGRPTRKEPVKSLRNEVVSKK
jgi:hypothetical protein